MKKWLSQFVQLAKQALVRHPIEILLVTCCVVPAFSAEPEEVMKVYADYLVWLPIAFMLVNLTHGSKYYRLSVLIPVAFVLGVKFFDIFDLLGGARFASLTLAVIVIFLCENVAKNNRTFMFGFTHKLFNCALAALIALLFGALGSGLAAAIQGLFHVNVYAFEVYQRLWLTAWIWIFPVAYLSLAQRKALLGEEWHLNDFIQILFNWILSPALILYTLVIYAYAVSILVQGKMPEGIVANVALPYLVAAIVLYVAQVLLDKGKWQKFYRLLPWLNILPLAMLWYAISIRIHHYGFTEERVYLVMGAVLVVLWNLILLVPGIRQYRLMAGVTLLALLSNSFVIDADKIAYKDQLVRFDAFVKAHQLVDENGKLSGERIEQWVEKNQDGDDADAIDEFRQLHHAVLLNTNEKWQEEFKQKYGIPKEDGPYKWMPSFRESRAYKNHLIDSFRIENRQQQLFPIQDYNQFLWYDGVVAKRYFSSSDADECRIELETVINSAGEVNPVDTECGNFLRDNYPPDFLLRIQGKNGEEMIWNLDAYLRDLFVQHNLDIHKRHTENELEVFNEDFKPYVVINDTLIIFDDFSMKYDRRGEYEGYVFENLSIEGVLSK
ncbi:DUF4153 domain-containing protein [Aggregatibacter actinomycetemcomitans]|nr:DUF4153 domain-containing protein [Aggregatibacter actinomycetemcomitans]